MKHNDFYIVKNLTKNLNIYKKSHDKILMKNYYIIVI